MKYFLILVVLTVFNLSSASAGWFSKDHQYHVRVSVNFDLSARAGFVSEPDYQATRKEIFRTLRLLGKGWLGSRELVSTKKPWGGSRFHLETSASAPSGKSLSLSTELVSEWSERGVGTFEHEYFFNNSCSAALYSHTVTPNVKSYSYFLAEVKDRMHEIIMQTSEAGVVTIIVGGDTSTVSEDDARKFLATLGPIFYRIDVERI